MKKSTYGGYEGMLLLFFLLALYLINISIHVGFYVTEYIVEIKFDQ